MSFSRDVQASLQLPMAKYVAQSMKNGYTLPSMPNCLDWDIFLPPGGGNFTSVDYWMKQFQKTLAYAKALQFWVKKAQPPWAGQPCQLVASVRELRDVMEPLTSFTKEEILSEDLLSMWVKVTLFWLTGELEPEVLQVQGHSRQERAHSHGPFAVSCSRRCLRLVAPSNQEATSPDIFTQRVEAPPDSPIVSRWMPPLGFTPIASSLRGWLCTYHHPYPMGTGHNFKFSNGICHGHTDLNPSAAWHSDRHYCNWCCDGLN